MHELIKREARKTTPLKELFEIIERKISDEATTNAYLNYMAENSTRSVASHISKIFNDVDSLNIRYLGNFALYVMRKEMTQALVYKAVVNDRSTIDDGEDTGRDETTAAVR
jgi:hypothetical protein